MADTTIIQELFAEFGFKIDKKSLETLGKTLKQGTAESVAFGVGWEKMAEKVVDAAKLIVKSTFELIDNLDTLYFASRRLGDSASNIQAYAYAMQAMGQSANQAKSDLMSFHEKLEGWGAGAPAEIRSLTLGAVDPTGKTDIQTRIALLTYFHNAIKGTAEFSAERQAILARLKPTGISEAEVEEFDPVEAAAKLAERERLAKAIGLGSGKEATEQAHKAADAINELNEVLGMLGTVILKPLIPIIGNLAEALANMGGQFGPLVASVSEWFGKLADSPFLKAVEAFVTAVGHLVMVLLRLIGFALKPLLPVLNALGTLIGGVVTTGFNALANIVNGVADLLSGKWKDAWKDWGMFAVNLLRLVLQGLGGVVMVAARLYDMQHGTHTAQDVQAFIDSRSKFLDQGAAEIAGAAGSPATAGAGAAAAGGGGAAGAAASSGLGGTVAADGGAATRIVGRVARAATGVGLAISQQLEGFLKGKNIRPDIARAIAAGVFAEGGWRIGGGVGTRWDPGHQGEAGHEIFGIGQWRGPRLAALRARFHTQFPSLPQQMQFLWEELTGQHGNQGGAGVLNAATGAAALDQYIGVSAGRASYGFMRPDAQGHYNDTVNAQGYYLATAGGGGGTNITQSVHNEVHGVSDPKKAADHVEAGMHLANARLIRLTQGRAS